MDRSVFGSLRKSNWLDMAVPTECAPTPLPSAPLPSPKTQKHACLPTRWSIFQMQHREAQNCIGMARVSNPTTNRRGSQKIATTCCYRSKAETSRRSYPVLDRCRHAYLHTANACHALQCMSGSEHHFVGHVPACRIRLHVNLCLQSNTTLSAPQSHRNPISHAQLPVRPTHSPCRLDHHRSTHVSNPRQLQTPHTADKGMSVSVACLANRRS